MIKRLSVTWSRSSPCVRMRNLGQVAGQRLVDIEHALLLQLHGRQCGERLGHRADTDLCGWGSWRCRGSCPHSRIPVSTPPFRPQPPRPPRRLPAVLLALCQPSAKLFDISGRLRLGAPCHCGQDRPQHDQEHGDVLCFHGVACTPSRWSKVEWKWKLGLLFIPKHERGSTPWYAPGFSRRLGALF